MEESRWTLRAPKTGSGFHTKALASQPASLAELDASPPPPPLPWFVTQGFQTQASAPFSYRKRSAEQRLLWCVSERSARKEDRSDSSNYVGCSAGKSRVSPGVKARSKTALAASEENIDSHARVLSLKCLLSSPRYATLRSPPFLR